MFSISYLEKATKISERIRSFEIQMDQQQLQDITIVKEITNQKKMISLDISETIIDNLEESRDMTFSQNKFKKWSSMTFYSSTMRKINVQS